MTRRTGTSDTVTFETPETEPLVPVIVAVPGATALTSPALFTVATPVLLDAHVTVWPGIVLPPASVTVPVSCCVCVTSNATVEGDTITAFAGGRVTVIGTLMETEPLVAVTIALPCDCPVTRPVEDTSAMFA